jgi:hypothetical protein
VEAPRTLPDCEGLRPYRYDGPVLQRLWLFGEFPGLTRVSSASRPGGDSCVQQIVHAAHLTDFTEVIRQVDTFVRQQLPAVVEARPGLLRGGQRGPC